MPKPRSSPWRRDSTKPASDKPGAVQSPAPAKEAAAPLEPSSVSPVQDGSDAVLASLEGLGLARDVAQVLLAQVKAENPNLSPLDLVATIADKLRERGPEVKPVKPRKSRDKAIIPVRTVDPADLRTIVSTGATSGATAYDALLAAGAVKPPLRDIAV